MGAKEGQEKKENPRHEGGRRNKGGQRVAEREPRGDVRVPGLCGARWGDGDLDSSWARARNSGNGRSVSATIGRF